MPLVTSVETQYAGTRTSWLPPKIVGGLVWSVVSIAVFTPWFRHAPCPVQVCDAPWTNALGWEFQGAFPYWVPGLAGLVGFAVGWAVVTILQRVLGRRASA